MKSQACLKRQRIATLLAVGVAVVALASVADDPAARDGDSLEGRTQAVDKEIADLTRERQESVKAVRHVQNVLSGREGGLSTEDEEYLRLEARVAKLQQELEAAVAALKKRTEELPEYQELMAMDAAARRRMAEIDARKKELFKLRSALSFELIQSFKKAAEEAKTAEQAKTAAPADEAEPPPNPPPETP